MRISLVIVLILLGAVTFFNALNLDETIGGAATNLGGCGNPECANYTINKTPKNTTNIKYSHFMENVLDIYFPPINSSSPLPAVIFIHGGGFISGDKDFINTAFKKEKNGFLKQNIIVISINYRLLNTASLNEILEEDIVAAVQYIKYNSERYNIDKDNIGIWGSSAGGGSALFLGTHDDFQDLNSDDGIKRESTSVKVIGHINSQATYDLSKWGEILEVDNSQEFDAILKQLANKNNEGIIDMLSFLDKDDPPIYIENLRENTNLNYVPLTKNIVNHHPKHGIYLYNQLIEIGINSKLVTKKNEDTQT